jgi:hypothetical protein
MSRSDGRPSVRLLGALALLTACTLAVQVTVTRLLSTVLAYHFSFLSISLALLGTGAGSLLVYIRPGWYDRRPLSQTLAVWSAVYGALLIVSPFVLVRLDYEQGQVGIPARFALHLSVACAVVALPAIAAGAVVALAIRGYPDHVGRVYGCDLLGAGLGAVLIVPLLRWPAPVLLVGLGVAACLAAVGFAWSDAPTRRWAGGLTAAGGAVLAVAALTSIVYIPMSPAAREDLAFDEWDPLSRVQTVAVPEGPFSLLFYDRVFAHVPMSLDERIPDWRSMQLGGPSIGYELTGTGRTLVIGGGGGRDIYNALSSQQSVDVIELNSTIVDAVDNSLADVSGSPYSRPGVSTTIGDGRSVLARRDTLYDTIHIGFTDTLSGNAAQGFALTENNLYTVEAFEEYFDHLAPGGLLNVSRLEHLVGDEALRITVLTMAALERHGVDDPRRNVVVVRGTDTMGFYSATYMTVLARLEPFTDDELDHIRALAHERVDGTAMIPGGPNYGPWDDLARADDWREFCHDYVLDVCPTTDDKPFFFNMRRLGDIFSGQRGYHYGVDPYQVLLLTLVILVVGSAAGLLAPLRLARTTERPTVASLLYFGAIGLGFLMLETALIQRFVLFLGFPTYALSIVLFALLLFTGIGSMISARIPATRRAVCTVLAATVAVVVVSAYTLAPLLRALIDQPFAIRVALSILLLAPIGVMLGLPMALGLRRFGALFPGSVAYAWGVNGVASVLASVLGVVIAINFGYVITSLVAGACYAAALFHAARGRWATDGDRASRSAGLTGRRSLWSEG